MNLVLVGDYIGLGVYKSTLKLAFVSSFHYQYLTILFLLHILQLLQSFPSLLPSNTSDLRDICPP